MYYKNWLSVALFYPCLIFCMEQQLARPAASTECIPRDWTPLHIAASEGNVIDINDLYSKGASIFSETNNRETPLHIAALNGHVAAMEALIALRSPIEDKNKRSGDTLLHCAARGGHREAIVYLLERGANRDIKNYDGYTPLHLAVQGGHMRALRLLVTGENKNAKNRDGWTPLHSAAAYGHTQVVTVLIGNYSVDDEPKTNYEETPLHLACQEGKTEAAKLLIENSHKNVRTMWGETALHYAARSGNVATIAVLVNENDVREIQDNFGKTPLHEAAYRGHEDAIRILLKIIDKETQDRFGQTALDVAITKNTASTVKLLLTAGCKVIMSTEFSRNGLNLVRRNGTEIANLLKAALNEDADFALKIMCPCSICSKKFIHGQGTTDSVDFNDLIEISCCKKYLHQSCLAEKLKKSKSCANCGKILDAFSLRTHFEYASRV